MWFNCICTSQLGSFFRHMGGFTISMLNLLLLEEMNHVLEASAFLHCLWMRMMLSVFGEMNPGLRSHIQMSNPREWNIVTLCHRVLKVCSLLRYWRLWLWCIVTTDATLAKMNVLLSSKQMWYLHIRYRPPFLYVMKNKWF